MLGCEDADPVDLLAGRPAPGPDESSDRLVLTADAVVAVVMVVVVAGPDAEPRLPLLDVRRLIHPRQLIVSWLWTGQARR
jgi:hypothetical protein